MIAIPAVDLRDGACVQLVGGSYENERIRLDNPVGVAQEWENAGFKQLHVVDLDAATGKGNNTTVVRNVLASTSLPTQVGGGVRDIDRIESLLQDGAARVVVGTRAIEDPSWLEDISNAFPDTIVLAADVQDRRVVTQGWKKRSARNIINVVDSLNHLHLAGIMVTAVHREGQMQGPDLRLMEDVVDASGFPVIASGGVSSMNDLRLLEDTGVHAVIIGMALYTGALSPFAVAEEFSEWSRI